MSSNEQHVGKSHALQLAQGPYILRDLIKDVPLSTDEDEKGAEDASITCVEYWSNNLYIGTSAGALLHYVSIPASDDMNDPSRTWIQASIRSLPRADATSSASQNRAVKQILLLPNPNKAFVLCNGLITIYSLPELTPTLASSAARLTNCTYLGGIDCNLGLPEDAGETENIIMICQKSRLRLVKIGDRLSQVKEIGFGGCLAAARRSAIACVADGTSYSLLDVVDQQRVSLFEILSGANDVPNENAAHDAEQEHASEQTTTTATQHNTLELPPNERTRSSSVTSKSSSDADQGKASDGGLQAPKEMESGHVSFPPRQSSLIHVDIASRPTHELENTAALSRSSLDTADKLVSRRPGTVKANLTNQKPAAPLIISPTSDRFLIVTGTSPDEAGMGMFVNLDGEPVPPTLEFSSFPVALCLDEVQTEGVAVPHDAHILAVVKQLVHGTHRKALEIQKLDVDPGASVATKHYLILDEKPEKDLQFPQPTGLRSTVDSIKVKMQDVVEVLASRRMQLSLDREIAVPANEAFETVKSIGRQRAESYFIARLANATCNVVCWAGPHIWTIARNPEILRVEARILDATSVEDNVSKLNASLIEAVIGEYREREPVGELDFFTLKYIRQKCSLMLFVDLLSEATQNIMIYERKRRITGDTLALGEIDARILLALVPVLRDEILEGRDGIWAPSGLQKVLDVAFKDIDFTKSLINCGQSGHDVLWTVKDYLVLWRRKKGFGSVSDEKEVFESVDAALIRLLLILDAKSPRGPATKGSIRAELNSIIDQGVDCFDRAIELIESFGRLYLLSRLYQRRKMAREVLSTWRRIIEGEDDTGGEFLNGEAEIRRYLTKINDASLVEEYGSWLAKRDPKLGVQVFADRSSKIRFEPKQTVKILQDRAPEAVKIFLEHLVFENHLAAYANDLITYYLDSVLTELETSSSSRQSVLSTYNDYRQLRPPKPTYSQFAEGLQITEDWWCNRLRLLQLLGGSHGAASQYDVSGMLARVQKHSEELVPEMIVLAGKQSQHSEAIRLLVHGLGDYDTAVSYCVRGGSSTYSPLRGSLPKDSSPSRAEQQALFRHLLTEFLKIEDADNRLAQTGELLARYGPFFDPIEAVAMIPAEWSVELLCGFIETSLRHLITEKNETAITKALLSSDNLNTNVLLIEKLEMIRPRIDDVVANVS